MGCLESCFKKEEGDPDERTPILQNEHRSAPNSIPVDVGGNRQEGTPVDSVSQSNQDEQSVLNGILSKYSADVIDVTAIDARIDAVEYMNRTTLYNRKLAGLTGRLEVPKPTLRSCYEEPVTILSGPPPFFNDVIMVSEICENLSEAMNNIAVMRKDDLTIDLAQK